MGYGLGGLFRRLARAAINLAKCGAKALGKIALNTGANVLGDVIARKSFKKVAKSGVNQAAIEQRKNL